MTLVLLVLVVKALKLKTTMRKQMLMRERVMEVVLVLVAMARLAGQWPGFVACCELWAGTDICCHNCGVLGKAKVVVNKEATLHT